MIAAHGMKPGFWQKFEGSYRIRPAINEIANRKQPVVLPVETYPVERVLEHRETAVNITDDPISPVRVDFESLNSFQRSGPAKTSHQAGIPINNEY